MRLSEMTLRDVQRATARVRREVRGCEQAAVRGNREEAFAAAERAQHAAFALKELFALNEEEINPAPTEDQAADEQAATSA